MSFSVQHLSDLKGQERKDFSGESSFSQNVEPDLGPNCLQKLSLAGKEFKTRNVPM